MCVCVVVVDVESTALACFANWGNVKATRLLQRRIQLIKPCDSPLGHQPVVSYWPVSFFPFDLPGPLPGSLSLSAFLLFWTLSPVSTGRTLGGSDHRGKCLGKPKRVVVVLARHC